MNTTYPIEWREISASPVAIRKSDQHTVQTLFSAEEWHFPTVPSEENPDQVLIWFRLNQHLEGESAMEPLKAVAPFVVGSHHIIMEKTDRSQDFREWDGHQKWVHFLYADGAVRVIETRHYRWNVVE